MAVAVIVGIIFATFLTLILVPVLYSVVDDMAQLFRRREPVEAEDEDSRGDARAPILAPPLIPPHESKPEVAAAVRS